MTHTTVEDLAGILPSVWKLLGDYARHVDGGDAVAWSRLFAEDGGMVMGEREVLGRDALVAFAGQSPRGVHIQSVPSVERLPDGGLRSTSNFMFVNAESHQIIAGEYRDDLAQTDDGMVFVRRNVEVRVRS